ncbi:MAG: DUF445 family protein [Ruminococcus sp.]|nr:DUF445 family protein [Ruminococcus sp.]
MNIEIITGPLVGAVIGLITNSLAIKMLFRPLNPVYLDRKNKKYKVPLTPGLIPKEKERLATAIGRIISNKLLDTETIKKALLSEDVHSKIVEKVESFVDGYATMESSIGELLQDKNYLEKIDEKEVLLKDKFSNYVTKKLLEINIGKVVVDFAMEEISKKMPMLKSMITKALNVEHLAEKIDTIAEEKVPSIVGNYVDKEYSNIKDKSVGEVVSSLVELYPTYAEKVWEFYKKVVEDKATQIIQEFNIAKIVEDKINEFDMEELEKMVMDIAKKELDALVWLGGLLGAIMGIVNAII